MYIIVNTQHEGDNKDGDDNDHYNDDNDDNNLRVAMMGRKYKHSKNGSCR
jgi:hypothetical protein